MSQEGVYRIQNPIPSSGGLLDWLIGWHLKCLFRAGLGRGWGEAGRKNGLSLFDMVISEDKGLSSYLLKTWLSDADWKNVGGGGDASVFFIPRSLPLFPIPMFRAHVSTARNVSWHAVFRIRIRLDPHSNWAWIRDPDPYSESGSGFRIQVSKNSLKKLIFTRADLNDENRKMLWFS